MTGDTLFIGDVGRPDLSRTHTPEQLAGMLYDSLHNKLLKLPDECWCIPPMAPVRSADATCAPSVRPPSAPSALPTTRCKIQSREEFITQLTSNLPARPEYFLQDAEINRGGAPALSDLPELKAISPAELKAMLEEGGIALDIRPGDQFAAGHVPGSINIPSVGTIRFLGGNDSRFAVASRAHRRHAGTVV